MAEEALPKLPPQNVEAEQSVLGSLLLDKDAIIRIADTLKPEDFYRTDHQQIYLAMLSLFEKRMPIDVVTLSDELEGNGHFESIGGATYLTTLVNSVPTASHVAHYAEIVQQKATLRRLISAAGQISQLGFDEDGDASTLLDRAEQSLFAVSQKYLKQNFVPIKEVLAESFERIDEMHKNKGVLRGVPTGFRDLDNLLSGFQDSDLVIIAARPSMGKTAIVTNIAAHAAIKENRSIAFFALEMSREQLADRLISLESGVDSWKIRTGNLSDEDFPKIGFAMGTLAEAALYIDDSPSLNVMEIRSKCRRLQMEKGLDLVVVDYLQLMEGRNRSSDNNRVQEISEISRSLKTLAREINVPVIALSQLSRAVEARPDKRPMLSDLRESGCLAGDTLIVRADSGALCRIANLVGETNIPVYSLDENNKIVVRRISRVFSSGRKQLYQLKFRSGRSIKATSNHKFRLYNSWLPLGEIKPGMRLAQPRKLAYALAENLDLTDDHLIVFAHMVGDGCYVARQPIHYTSADIENIKVVSSSAKRAFGIDARITMQNNWFHLYLPSPYRLARGRYHPFKQWLTKLGLDFQRSYQKYLPNQLFLCSDRQIKLFLHHLWATDGCISCSDTNVSIYYATTSPILAEQVQHLLLRQGIQSTVREQQQRKGAKIYRPIYHVTLQGKVNQELFLQTIGCFGARGRSVTKSLSLLAKMKSNPNVDSFDSSVWSEMIIPSKKRTDITWREFQQRLGNAYCGSTLYKAGLSRDRLSRVASILADPKLASLAESNLFWDEVIEIEPLGVEEVFDATVPGTHNFVANDIVVHNSIEQDADVVIFIYRDDYYHKDAENKGITELLVRKHRNGPIGDVELLFIPEQTRFRSVDRKRGAPPSHS